MPKHTSKYYLQSALTELGQSKSVMRITVSELCEAANLNRTTFYRNFETMDDFLDNCVFEIAEAMVTSYEISFDDIEFLKDPENVRNAYISYFTTVKNLSKPLKLFLGPNGIPQMQEAIIDQGVLFNRKLYEAFHPQELDPLEIDIAANYLAGAHYWTVVYYLSHDDTLSIEKITDRLMELTYWPYLSYYKSHKTK